MEVVRMKSKIKQKIIRFWQEHRNFDDKNPDDIYAAEELFHELYREYPEMEIIETLEELRDEAEKAVERAREEFLEAVKKVNKGEYDDAPIPGVVGEIKGESSRLQGGDKE